MNQRDWQYFRRRQVEQNEEFRNAWRLPPEPKRGLPLWVYLFGIAWVYGLWLAFA